MDRDDHLAQCYLFILECRRRRKLALAEGERRQAQSPTTKADRGKGSEISGD